MQSYYKILRDFVIVVPYSSERLDRSPAGSIAVYEDHLKVGLHFSLHPFFIQIFNLYHVVPA